MNNKLHLKIAQLITGLVLFLSYTTQAQTLPYEVTNNSEYPDSDVYVAIVGITDGHVWVDAVTGQVNPMDPSNNTVQGPVIDGNQGPGENGKYANCFRRLSEIPNKTIQIPKIAGCRIMISFKSQLYLYFFGHSGSPSGYSAPNLANPTDPNQGIKFELIELTFNDIGLWCNTSRVDSYQYPMGLEVWGDNFYKKVGELKKHNEITAQWQTTAPEEFQGLLNVDEGTIHFPTKVASFPTNFMDGYINDIWNKYTTQELAFTSDAGNWRGQVQNGDQFVFTRDSDGQVATIFGKPTTLAAMEGSGVMASGDRWDLVVQAQMVAAITRHAVDLNIASGVLQDFGDTSKYYQTWPYNWYSKFFHQTDISFESQTYTFAYDDVYSQSATVHTPNPSHVKITIGGLDSQTNDDDDESSLVIEAESYSNMYGVAIETCSEGGENVGYIDAGDWMAYNDITFSTSGDYLIEYRVASTVDDAILSADINAGTTVLGQVNILNTGGWQSWATVSHTVNINAGTYPFGIYATSGNWNINWIKITKQNSTQSLAKILGTIEEVKHTNTTKIYPNPFTNSIQLKFDKTNASIVVFDVLGHVVIAPKTIESGTSIDLSNLNQGLYLLTIETDGVKETRRLIKE